MVGTASPPGRDRFHPVPSLSPPAGVGKLVAFGSTKQRCLVRKGAVWIFEEGVYEDDEFAHTGGDGDERSLSGGPQALIRMRSWRMALQVAM